MKKEIIEVPVLSPMMRELGIPCSSETMVPALSVVRACDDDAGGEIAGP